MTVWGKSRGLPTTYPLVCHLCDAGLAAAELFDSYLAPAQRALISDALCGGDERAARTLTVLLAVAHDLGKCTPLFQSLDAHGYAASGAEPWTPVTAIARVSHPDAGATHLHDWLVSQGVPAHTSTMIALVVAGHHGIYPAEPRKSPAATGTGSGPGSWADQRTHLFELALTTVISGADLAHLWTRLHFAAHGPVVVALNLITGQVITADWLVSDTTRFLRPDHAPRSAEDLPAWAAHQAQRVRDRITWCGLRGEAMPRRSMEVQFPHIPQFEPRGLQRSIVEDLGERGAGLFLLMDRAGGGKTEGALHLASRLSASTGAPGFVLALPTMATTDAMVDRCVRFARHAFASRAQLTVMHSLAALNPQLEQLLESGRDDISGYLAADGCTDENTGLVVASEWLQGRRLGLLAANTVCTVDQILAVAIAASWQPLPFLGLSRKVVVIDEVHAQDAHMQQLTSRLVSWLAAAGASVVAMSATLPRSVALTLVRAYQAGRGLPPATELPPLAYPGWVHVNPRDGHVDTGSAEADREHSTRFTLRPYTSGPVREDSLAEAVAANLSTVLEGAPGNALVVVNTVRGANQVCAHLRRLAPDLEVSLFHARFPNRVRAEKAAQLLEKYGPGSAQRPTRSVVVATQVAEQSLDIDFDVIVSELAPISSLIQRDGRLHRHARPQRPVALAERSMVILAAGSHEELDDRDRAPYDQADLLATWQALQERTGAAGCVLHVPADVPALMERVHSPDRWAPDLPEQLALAAQRGRDDVKRQVAVDKALPLPQHTDRLEQITRQDGLDPDFATRYDMNQVTVLPVALDAAGQWRLGAPDGPPVPSHPDAAAMREVLGHCVALSPPSSAMTGWLESVAPRAWTEQPAPGLEWFRSWQTSSVLRHVSLVIVDFAVSTSLFLSRRSVSCQSVSHVDRHLIRFDPEYGCSVELVQESP